MTIQAYQQGRIIGHGSYGHVLSATHKETNEQVAIKCISKSNLLRAKKTRSPIIEKECLSRLTSPHVVSFKEYFEDRFQIYFVLELLPNGTLTDFLQKKPKIEEIRNICAQILLILSEIHRQGIIHRDIKPENFLFDSENRMKIIDFGSAKLCEKGGPFARGSFVGSVDYIPPEIIGGESQTPGIDLWGLGCLVYRAFCEQPPFYAETKMGTYQNIESVKYTIPEEVPSDAADLIQKLLRKNAEERLGFGEEEIDYESIRNHPFFTGIDWSELRTVKL
jgi:3-phosphoinositide dependent protein kinase-1